MNVCRQVSRLCVMVCLLSCNPDKKGDAPKNSPPVVDVLIAEKQTVMNTIEANGTVISNEFVELHPEVSGRITYLNVPEGRYIEKGTVIARINDADLEAQLQKLKVQLDLAVTNEERLRQLLSVNGINQSDYDAALNNVNSLKADIAYYQALIEKTYIRAPFSGTVGLRQLSIGAYVSPSDVVATIQELSKLKIDFTLPEEYSPYISNGKKVEVEYNSFSGNRFPATIAAVEPGANTLTRNLKVRAILPNARQNPGAYAKVYITAGGSTQSIVIPTNCIIPNDAVNQVVIIKNGEALFSNVQTGIRKSNSVEITSGIDEGDSVVVTGLLFVRPNSPVTVRGVVKANDLKKDSL